MTNPIQTFEGIYCVTLTDSTGKTDWSFAITPQVNQVMQRVMWNDGEKGRLIDYKKLSDVIIESLSDEGDEKQITASKITVLDSFNQRSFVLEPLTLEKYDAKLKDRLSGHPTFKNETEMTNFFQNLKPPPQDEGKEI